MSIIDVATQQKTLEDLRLTLIAELSTIAVHNKATDDWEVAFFEVSTSEADDDMEADHNEEADERIATLALLETRYRNVVRALHNIETKTYGICEVCGEEIEPARLLANPAARTCTEHLDDEVFLPL
jgi:RNA polymerase-binding transcription factor DksA